MNVDQKVATLEALLVRVKRNAAEARPPRALHLVGDGEADQVAEASTVDAALELPPELAHAVLPAPASSRTPAAAAPAPSPKPPPVESPKPLLAESPKPPSIEPEPESRPRLVALAPPLATASRAPRSPTPTYGMPAQREAAKADDKSTPKPAAAQESPKPAAARPITPQTPAVVERPPTPAVAAKPAASRVAQPPRTAAPVFDAAASGPKAPAPAASRAKEAATGPAHERSGAKTLMGTGLDEMRKALAQLDDKATDPRARAGDGSKAPAPPTTPSATAQPHLLGAEKISDDTTGEGATLVRSSPFDVSTVGQPLAKHGLVEEASTEDEQTVLIPQPTQEELIAASERGAGGRRRAVEDESGEGDTLVKESPFAAASAAASGERRTVPMEAEPPTLAKPQTAAKLGAMGTMLMPPAAASPAAPPPPEPPAPTAATPATTPGRTVIMEPALAATVQSESPPAPAPPQAATPPGPMAGPMAGPMETPAVAKQTHPEHALPVGPSGPEQVAQPSFLRDGPVYEAPLPARKKGRGGMIGVGLAAAALVGAGVFLSLRNGWIDELIGSATGVKATPTASARPAAPPSATASAAPTAAEPASAAPVASAAPSAPPSASAVASATPSASPSAKPAAGSADASALPKTKGILMINATQPGVVYVNGKFAGNAGEPLTVDCGIRYIRLAEPGAAPGKPPTFMGHGRPLKIACRNTTEAVLPAPPGLDGPARAPEEAPAPGGNPAPDL